MDSNELTKDLEMNVKNQGPSVTFSNLLYCVQEQKLGRKYGPEKYILKDVR